MKKLTLQIGSVPETRELRSGDFFLMPENPIPPVIVSDLDKNVRQKTWVKEYIMGEASFFEIQPLFGVYSIIAGTELEMSIIAEDPSLVDASNVGDDSNLTYVWKKDGASMSSINSLKNGKGISGLNYPAADVDAEIAGTYTCEVSNAYGTTISSRIRVEVVDTLNHPMLYKNLLKNGSSTQNWTNDADIIARSFLSDETLTRGYGSLPRFLYYDTTTDKVVGGIPEDFRFCQGGHGIMLTNILTSWYKKDKDLYDISKNSNPDTALEGWMSWLLKGYPSQIVPNEDLDNWKYAGFFPGLKWIDSYNKNTSKVIGLLSEAESQVLSYITRDKIKFKKDGGREVSSTNQVIDITNISQVVDGNITGLQQLNGQFFAYVGAGITGYKIKATTTTGEKLFNWYVLDSDDFFNRLKNNVDNRIKLVEGSIIEIIPLMEDTTQISIIAKNANDVELSRVEIEGPSVSDVFAIKEKSQLPITWYPIFDLFITNNNQIQIFGQTYSDTNSLLELMSYNPAISGTVVVGYDYKLKLVAFDAPPQERQEFKKVLLDVGYTFSRSQQIISSKGEINLESYISKKELEGYQARDFEPTTPTNVPGWQYLRVKEHYDHMKELLQNIHSSIILRIIPTAIYSTPRSDNDQTRINDINKFEYMDRNAAFFIKKVPYKNGGSYFPQQAPDWSGETRIDEKRTLKALQDYGAAAMFAVGSTFAIPKNTRSLQVLITFTHTSEAIDDDQPEVKGWTKPQIYRNDYGATKLTSRRFVEYGYPRCGVSMAKLMLMSQDAKLSSTHPSYYLPPPDSTVLGLRRKKLYEDSNNTSQPGLFNYNLLIPKALPSYGGIDVFSLNNSLEAYERGVRRSEKDVEPQATTEQLDNFERNIITVEDASEDRLENIENNTAIDEGLATDIAESM
jgi:hypothetical protein